MRTRVREGDGGKRRNCHPPKVQMDRTHPHGVWVSLDLEGGQPLNGDDDDRRMS